MLEEARNTAIPPQTRATSWLFRTNMFCIKLLQNLENNSKHYCVFGCYQAYEKYFTQKKNFWKVIFYF